jgi:hypothetical protein
MIRIAPALLLLALAGGCRKVPLNPVGAGFTLADAAWFAEEETLFLFWELEAEQGLGETSVIQVRWTTDDGLVDWLTVRNLEPVHTHLEVDCGPTARCGSTSLIVPREPRDVDLRLLYHVDGPLALEADTTYNVVGPGRPHLSRSLLVYGVFDESNTRVQWRSRHRFPTVSNLRATALGLRRDFEVEDATHGTLLDPEIFRQSGAFGYGAPCPDDHVATGLDPVGTDARAVFHPEPIPDPALDAAALCAEATVTDATGAFTTTAWARKNPEVRPAFPLLRSPVEDATPLRFFLAPCSRTISVEHADMQRQRLQAEATPTTCTDDVPRDALAARLAADFRDAVEAARPAGNDMVLVVGVHRDDPAVVTAVEEALLEVVPPERDRSSPRVAGAFVFDSDARGLDELALAQTTLWCPATIDPDDIPTASARSCPVVTDIPDLSLGPLSVTQLPILPTRSQYLDFIDTYSVGSAGEVLDTTYRAPRFATDAETVDLGPFGAVTFLNGESIDAAPEDAFSWCPPEAPPPVVFRSPLLDEPALIDAVLDGCAEGLLPESWCQTIAAGVLPIEALGTWHAEFREPTYALGLFWEFPFLLQAEFRAALAGAITAFGFSVPFGISAPQDGLLGAALWDQETIPLDEALTQCRRHCDHPTFDSAGVYQVNETFRNAYAEQCYQPRHPRPGDSGFPLDP